MTEKLDYCEKRIEDIEDELSKVLAGKLMPDVMMALINMLAIGIRLMDDPETSLEIAIGHLREVMDEDPTHVAVGESRMMH